LWALINPGNKTASFLLIAAALIVVRQMEPPPLAAFCPNAYVNQETVISTSSGHHVKAQLVEDVISIRLPSLSFSFLSDITETPFRQFFIHPIAVVLEKASFPLLPELKKVFYHLVNINAP
jgi:hypothetical protein